MRGWEVVLIGSHMYSKFCNAIFMIGKGKKGIFKGK